MYADQVQFVEVNGGVAVDPGVGCPENDLSGLWVDQPPVLVAGLVRQRDGDLPEIKAAQLKHQTTVFPCKLGRPTGPLCDDPSAAARSRTMSVRAGQAVRPCFPLFYVLHRFTWRWA